MGLFDILKGKPDPPNKEEIVSKAFAQLDALMRPASIATLGGQRPTVDQFASRFSGDFVMLPDEQWPTWNGKPLQAFVQINMGELPATPAALRNYLLITVFVDEEPIPLDRPHGDGWVVRCYTSLVGLTSRKNPIAGSPIKPFEIMWSAFDDSPSWEDIPTDMDMKAFNELKGSDKLLEERYQTFELTKVGGWPSLIQSELEMGVSNFLFQIGSEEKAHWNCVDAGTMYFGIVNGEWKFECQFY